MRPVIGKVEPYRVQFIDGWRTIAVSLVILSHLNRPAGDVAPQLHNPIFDFGLVGVFIFFYISGYVVSRSCLEEFGSTRGFSVLGFYARRTFRIAPPLVVYVLFCAMMSRFGKLNFGIENGLPSLFYICNVSLFDCQWAGGHTWSLAFEEQFYLIFALVFSSLLVANRALILFLLPAAAFACLPVVWPLHYVGRTGFIVIYTLFFVGYLSARFEKQIYNAMAAPALLCVLGGCITFLGSDIIASLISPDAPDAKLAVAKYYKFAYVVAIPMLVFCSGCITVVRNSLSGAVITAIGRASYSIYLWQQLATSDWFVGMPERVAAILVVVVGSIFSYIYIEKRLIRAGRRVSDWLNGR